MPNLRALLVTHAPVPPPHQRAQSQAVAALQNNYGSYSSGFVSGMCCPPLPPRAMHMASSIPIANSNISGFVVLSEPLLDSVTNMCPSCLVIGRRPVPAVSSTPRADVPYPPPPLAPVPAAAVLPHSHSSPGLMMFGALVENEASLVGSPGQSVANSPPPQPANHHHSSMVLNSSQHQPGNAVGNFHAIVEDLPPKELFDP